MLATILWAVYSWMISRPGTSTVVHINAAIAGLVGSFVIGKRIGYGKEAMKPHNLVYVMTGAALLRSKSVV